MFRDVGIVGVGSYVPDFRVSAALLSAAWGGHGGEDREKSVANDDEDAATMAVEAARLAMLDAGDDPDEIDVVWVGTESKPYAVKAVSATVAEAIAATPWVGAADLEFACRGGVEGLLALAARVESGRSRSALLIAVDSAQGRPGDDLERTAGAAAAAFVLGPAARSAAVLSDSVSRVTDTPDFYRRDGASYPTHAHRFSAQPAYLDHVVRVVREFLERTSTRPQDYRLAVFHQPTSKLPRQAAKALGFSADQVEPVLAVDRIGNPYAASAPLGLARAIGMLEPGEMALISSYGSGAGADCFAIRATEAVRHRNRGDLDCLRARTHRLDDYGQYLRMTRGSLSTDR